MPMPRLQERTLTGAIRARPGWFGRQILQVEIAVLTYSSCPPMPDRSPREWTQQMKADGELAYEWRDATWEESGWLAGAGILRSRGIEPIVAWPRR